MNNESSHLRDFTRGGQIFTHSLHMFWQVLKGGLMLALVIFFVSLYALVSRRLTEYDGYIFWQSIEAELKLVVFDSKVKLQIRNPDNSVVTFKAIDFVRSPKTRFHINKCKRVFWTSSWQSALISLAVLTLYCVYLKLKGRRENQNIPINGQTRVSAEFLSECLKARRKASDFSLASVPLLKQAETQHLLLAGTTGTGKSLAMQELMDQVRINGQRAIVYDIDGSFIPAYYREGKDVLLNPLDERVPAWNIWEECRDLADFDAAALSLMPEHLAGTDPFWIRSAHTIFSSAALKLSRGQCPPQTRDLLDPIFGEGLKSLGDLLSGTPGAPLVLEEIDKTALSIKATLSNYCKSLLYLKPEANERLFSIRRWIEADTGDSWLFIASNAQKIDALRSLLSVWLDVAAKSILSLKSSRKRRLWFFLDELPSLHKLPSLMNALSRGRKFGACFVAAIQDVHQLYGIYGKNYAESLTALFNSKVFYRTQEPDSAVWMSRVIGNREYIEKKEGFSYGAHAMRDGVSIHAERRQEPILPPSAFLELNDLSAYLKLPGDWPVARLTFELKARLALSDALWARDLTQILALEAKVTEDNRKILEGSPPSPPILSLQQDQPLREI